ncbi:MAG: PTS sugar transporter subunit IIA [Desulfamplus sp.]|nr:PTS sugar transporter subunit IIA [Desulfamplus sp.]MBF0411808.1 PTS sugar transporter subunit IIA [Desulfamplus sp.]
MKISDILDRNSIISNLNAKNKKGVLEELAGAITTRTGTETKDIVRVLLEREQLGSTGIGGGIAIPHGKLDGISSIVVGFGLSREGVEFDSLDNRPVHIFFLLITPANSTGIHLSVLAQISRLLKQSHFKDNLMKAESAEEIEQIINSVDEDF